MKRFALLLFAATVSLWADPDAVLIEKIYAKLAASFSAGQALGQGGNFLLLAHPGFALNASSLGDAYEISQLADQIPLRARYYIPSGSFYSSTYNTILTQAEVTNFLNQTNRQAALQARRVTYDRTRPGQPTPAYAAYLKYEAAYYSALDALTVARTEQRATGKAVPPGLDKAVETAEKEWYDKGSRKIIEDANKALVNFYNENVKALFASLLSDFTSAMKTAGHPDPWYPVTATPPPQEWLSDKDWKPFTLTSTEKNLAPQAVGIPLEAKTGPAVKKLPDDFLTTVSITLEAKRVEFARPWLDERIFSSHGWRLLKSSGFTTVSTGNPADKDPGLMPFLVKGVLISRKLELKGSYAQGSADDIKALGPFALTSATGASVSRKEGKLTIAAPKPQIIGFICAPVPKSPSPDAKAFRTP